MGRIQSVMMCTKKESQETPVSPPVVELDTHIENAQPPPKRIHSRERLGTQFENASVIPLGPSYDNNSIVPVHDREDSPKKSKNSRGRCRKNTSAVITEENFETEVSRNLTDQPNDQVGSIDENTSTNVCAPQHRDNEKASPCSPSDNDVETGQQVIDKQSPKHSPRKQNSLKDLKRKAKPHIGLFPFGVVRTLTPVILSIVATACSIMCKQSTSFVTLERPIYIDAKHNTVSELGLFYMDLCRTNEYININVVSGDVTLTQVEYDEVDADDLSFFYSGPTILSEQTFSNATDQAALGRAQTSNEAASDCRKFRLDSTLVQDRLWNTARVFVGFTTGIGFMTTAALIAAIFWKSVNITAVSVAVFVSYLCQSFAFLFYDTTVCRKYLCYRSSGTNLAIIASVCWFFAGIGTLWIYMYDRTEKHKKLIQHVKQKKTLEKQKKKEERFLFSQWALLSIFQQRSTADTTCTGSSSSSLGPSRVSL